MASSKNDKMGYIVTGRAAHGRVARLFRNLLEEEEAAAKESNGHDNASGDDVVRHAWIDQSPYATNNTIPASPPSPSTDQPANDDTNDIGFLWENAPRSETKYFRDSVKCYSHLPNGILLDDKWALARLLGRGGGEEDGNAAGGDGDRDEDLAALESHCFRGGEFEAFAGRIGLLPSPALENESKHGDRPEEEDVGNYQFQDLIVPSSGNDDGALTLMPPPSPSNLWVLKDAASNGAGGIWILDQSNAQDFIISDDNDGNDNNSNSNNNNSILHPQHRYIAQRYAWPPTLYGGRKCHVRVYALITCDGKAYIHKRAFLHIANELFQEGDKNGNGEFEASVHITNCCANSHDESKFAGEICADLEVKSDDSTDDNDDVVPLGEYFPSMAASVAALAKQFAPFAIKGGEANGGFEYLGLDFVLSSVEDDTLSSSKGRRPVAYLLEVNAPPSQDTATGLPHAEELHDAVISDLIKMWVLPNLDIAHRKAGGWKCVHAPPEKEEANEEENNANLIVPSKAAILNRIRWAMFERRSLKEEALALNTSSSNDAVPSDPKLETKATPEVKNGGGLDTKEEVKGAHGISCEFRKDSFDHDAFATFVRSQFPYFSEGPCDPSSADTNSGNSDRIFFESGGGAQVPKVVSDAMMSSLTDRDRSVAGARQLRKAREALTSLLIDQHDSNHVAIMGANATSLLDQLAQKINGSGLISKGDEIVIASENHLANVTPWVNVAKLVGAKLRWWTVSDANLGGSQQQKQLEQEQPESSCILSDLINAKTKIIAISHVSNILGQTRDIQSVCDLVHRVTQNRAQVVVDGVAAAPHLLPNGPSSVASGPDWYVVSLHKMFGPHLGCLIGKRSSLLELHPDHNKTSCSEGDVIITSNEKLAKSWELGTMNYEACAGAIALKQYFDSIATHALENYSLEGSCCSEEEDQNATRAAANDMDNEHCCLQQHQTSNQITIESSNDHLGESNSHEMTSEKGDHISSDYLNIARMCIKRVEAQLLNHLLVCLAKYAPLVRILQDVGKMKVTTPHNKTEESNPQRRIPIVSFVHSNISSRAIVQHCRNHGVICRACNFLSTKRLRDELGIDDDGVVRISLAHYNTLDEINSAVQVLEMLDGWSGYMGNT